MLETPVRSLLFVPALDGRKLDRALNSGADALILDLEGSIAPAAKPDARREAAAFLTAFSAKPQRPRLYVRVNDLESGFCIDDLAAVVPERPDALVLPKARSGADVARLAKQIDALERYAGLKQGRIGILPIATETPRALLTMASFVDATPRLIGLAWGKSSLRAALGAYSTRGVNGRITAPYALARTLCLITAHAAGTQAIDCIFSDLNDHDGLAREAAEAARDGFTAKLAIHPSQIAFINEAFTPLRDEVDAAAGIIAAFEAAGTQGVIVFKGRMLYRPDLEHAQDVLRRARAAGQIALAPPRSKE
jgi:citrate lyase subunit beta/citryl-CoA lyase